jgi:hypothetical protein
VQGGGLKLEHFSRTAPAEWSYVLSGYGWVLIILAAMGSIVALVRRPAIFLFAAPYVVTASSSTRAGPSPTAATSSAFSAWCPS